MDGSLNFMQLVLLAILAESVWETLKLIWEKDKVNIDRLGAILTTIVIALATGIDFFNMLGLPLRFPYAGSVFTGIIASRGANFIHDLLKITEGLKMRSKA
jgi:hypothetical protein